MINGVTDCAPESVANIGDSDDVVSRLAPGVVLWGPLCEMGAYNEVTVFFLGDEYGGSRKRLTFEEPVGSDPPKDDLLENVAFDAKTQTLSSFAKGRGIGDCGSEASWVWDGHG